MTNLVTLCVLNGQICKADTPAKNTLHRKGLKSQFYDVCQGCTDVLLEQQRELLADPKTCDQVVEVTVSSLVKVEWFIAAGEDKGKGLTVRKGKGDAMLCSGPECTSNRTGKTAVTFDGVVYDLCGSCATACWLAAERAGIPNLHPVRRDIAVAKAERVAADRVEAERAAAAKARHEEVVSKKAHILNNILLDEPAAPRPRTAADLPITRHLEDCRGLPPDRRA